MHIKKSSRIISIDVLRGIVMVLMALDHTRDYFHLGAFFYDPTDLSSTTTAIFLTRFVTHFCAPVFIFLAGTSAYLYGANKSKRQVSKFLWTRGLWIIFLEVTINNFIWFFDYTFSYFNLQVLWAIGFAMVILAALIYLPYKWLLGLGALIVVGHNLLDGIVMEGNGPLEILWYFTHQFAEVPLTEDLFVSFRYPLLPWLGVMVLGYCFGRLYAKGFDPGERKKWLLRLALGALILFILIRFINVYGNLEPWSVQKNTLFTFFSFINISKYPPSLDFILLTLGASMLFLYAMENVQNKFTQFILAYGRVALFYYLIHMVFIHVGAILLLIIRGEDWGVMLFREEVFIDGSLAAYGYPLWFTYLIWILIVLALYFPCRKYMEYKAANKDKWWLSYL